MVQLRSKWQAAGEALKTRRRALKKIIVACCGVSGVAGEARRAQAAKSEPTQIQGAAASMQLAESLAPDDRMVVIRGALLQARIADVSGFILNEGPIQGYAMLRQYTGTLTRLLVSQHPAGHRASDIACYRLDPDDASSADNGGTIIVSKSGKRWKRVFEGDIYARWFGAQGDGIADDADAINRAVAFAGACYASIGRAQRVVLDNGTFRIAAASGTLAIPCHDDGRTRSAKDKRLAPEPALRQAYCVGAWPGVKICGINAVVKGGYRYGMADARQPVTFGLLDGHDTAFEAGLENLTFIDCFMAFGALSATLACCIFDKLRFLGCGIGIYAAVLEQCMFSNIEAQGTGVPVLVGGQWADRNDDYNERGGFADKCTFINVRNIYSRAYGDDERRIDTWFDAAFFKTRNNESRLSAQLNAASQAKAYPYRGICGFCIRVMSRYARPSNANVFMQIRTRCRRDPPCSSMHVSPPSSTAFIWSASAIATVRLARDPSAPAGTTRIWATVYSFRHLSGHSTALPPSSASTSSKPTAHRPWRRTVRSRPCSRGIARSRMRRITLPWARQRSPTM
jgi:hypothetical protein